MKFDLKATLPLVEFHPRMLFSMEKSFLWLCNFGEGRDFLSKITYCVGQVKRKSNWYELTVKSTLLLFPDREKGCFWSMAKSPRKSEFYTPWRSFQLKPCWDMDTLSKVDFALSGNYEDQLRESHNAFEKN